MGAGQEEGGGGWEVEKVGRREEGGGGQGRRVPCDEGETRPKQVARRPSSCIGWQAVGRRVRSGVRTGREGGGGGRWEVGRKEVDVGRREVGGGEGRDLRGVTRSQ